MRSEDCDHKRVKRTFPHGRNSAPIRQCKDCGKFLTKLEIKNNRKRKNKPKREREEYPENYMEKKI